MTAPVLVTPKAEPIAMTAPVLVTPGQSTGDTMAFVLPASKYKTIDEAPAPTDPRVRLRRAWLALDPSNSESPSHWHWLLTAGRPAAHPEADGSRLASAELPERLQASRVFSWSFGSTAAQRQLETLLADLKRDGWVPRLGANGQVDWQAAGYNPPFALPFMKRNEVLVTVEEKAQ
jgi:hypothetical protein